MIRPLKDKTIYFAAALLAGAFLSGCGASTHATQVYKESPVEVYLAQTIGKDGEPVDAGYQHPLELSPREVFLIIRSVQVRIAPGKIQKIIAKSENETGPAFNEDDGGALAVGLSKVLAAATPAERIHFQINHPNPFHGGTLSTGVLFVKDARLQLILQNLRHAPGAGTYDKNSRFKKPGKAAFGQKLKIIPGPTRN